MILLLDVKINKSIQLKINDNILLMINILKIKYYA